MREPNTGEEDREDYIYLGQGRYAKKGQTQPGNLVGMVAAGAALCLAAYVVAVKFFGWG